MARRLVSEAIRADWLKSISRYLKVKRKRQKMTQAALAQSLSVNINTIQKIEARRLLPSRELAADIGEVFDEPQTAMAAAGYGYIPFVGWQP